MSPLLAALALALVSPSALALGLGELRTQSRLGDRLHVEIELIVHPDERVEAGCVRLKKPAADDLPWVRQGSHSIRRGTPSVLTIRADGPVFDPIIQVGVHVGCGFEVQRDYTIFLSPRMVEPELPVSERLQIQPRSPASERRVPRQRSYEPIPPRLNEEVPAFVPRPPRAKAGAAQSGKDRLVLFGGSDGREPSLALATSLASWQGQTDSPERESMRESLRVEYRMLQALHQQALTLLETAEKLRQLEQTLGELQQRTDDLVKQGGVLPAAEEAAPAPVAQPANVAPPPAPPIAAPSAKAPARESDTGFWFYGGLAVALLAMLAWLLWRYWQNRQVRPELSRFPPELLVDPQRGDELGLPHHEAPDPGELAKAAAAKSDAEFDETSPPPELKPVPTPAVNSFSSNFSVASATVDEHFEVNPVMELADIMLSFGRVKGAAQALQEFVDHSPEEALQPWIRLMEVYRMAGMREEFERVAANLNQYFNVEVQHWDASQPGTLVPKVSADGVLARDEPLPIEWPSSAKKARSIEEMPHICGRVLELWGSPEVEPYLQTLLRDNRGGLRSGFAIEVVDDILMLSQLLETMAKMDAEAAAAAVKETKEKS